MFLQGVEEPLRRVEEGAHRWTNEGLPDAVRRGVGGARKRAGRAADWAQEEALPNALQALDAARDRRDGILTGMHVHYMQPLRVSV